MPAWADTLQLTVTEGDGLEVPAGTRSFGGVSVQVTDAMGNPVVQAKVSFRLPETGPSGLFPNGQRLEEQSTDGQGRASAWGIQWGTQPGDCHVAIFAHHAGASAGTTARIRIKGGVQGSAPAASFEVPIAKPAPSPPPPSAEDQAGAALPPAPAVGSEPGKRPGVLLTRTEAGEERISSGRGKWVAIGLGIAGAVGGFAAYKFNGKTTAPAAAAAVTGPVLTLSAPTITIGKP